MARKTVYETQDGRMGLSLFRRLHNSLSRGQIESDAGCAASRRFEDT